METTPMANFAVPPMETIRVGFIGVGNRGHTAVRRVSELPGIEVAAIGDVQDVQVEATRQFVREAGRPGACHAYSGSAESWKAVCDDDGVDVVYIASPAEFHAEMALYALRAGKHVLTEVPGAQTVDEAWEIVETCEKARRHCMMLENCCYGEMEMLAQEIIRKGLLGTLTYAEGGYIHNLTARQLDNHYRNRGIMKPGLVIRRYGNTYPTHPLGPICLYFSINRGDRMERIVSLSSLSAAHSEFAAATYPADAWQNQIRWETGDVDISVIRTALGRVITLQLGMCTPRPYSRINLVQGTKGCFADYPPRVALSEVPGGESEWLDDKAFAEFNEAHKHPLWKRLGEIAREKGGHGGMDYIMDLRWSYCMRNGLPLDMDVYDLASWSSVVPCSAESDRQGGIPVELPDFTRGAWRTARPADIGDISDGR
ncbi:MAG: Gfo/Idh/MocA family oxidoreductase [Kiritimatiellae bacterium]|nr:Gfo/Idh/MocA family oxidoreductase [Kiritimatiellia bacterium]